MGGELFLVVLQNLDAGSRNLRFRPPSPEDFSAHLRRRMLNLLDAL
jgi:hypothetical protein